MNGGMEESDVLPEGPYVGEDRLAVPTGHLTASVDVHVLLQVGHGRK